MQLILSKNLVVFVDEHNEISGGNIMVNGKTYEDVTPVSYDGELPPDIAIPEKYIFQGGILTINPETEGNDINTRLNDIEQILIELLDTL